MLSNGNTINLEDFRARSSQGISKVFTGRDRGAEVRDKSKIDEIEVHNDKVNIIIPDDIYSINPSFFEELFVNVVKKLGKTQFISKFEFSSIGNYNYQKPLEEAIERILRDTTALDK